MDDCTTQARCESACRRVVGGRVRVLGWHVRVLGELAGVLIVAAFAAGSQAIARPVGARADRERPRAAASRVVALKETGELRLTNGYETTLDGRGRAAGTYDCSIVVRLTITSAHHLTTSFTVSPRGGTISGRGSARYAEENGNGYFGGTIVLTRGTGSYSHAWGSEIGISGKISRESLWLTVRVHGLMRV